MARPAVIASVGALAVCACSVGLPDNLDSYGKKSDGQGAGAVTLGPNADGGADGSTTLFPPSPEAGIGADGGGGVTDAPHVPSCLPKAKSFTPPSWAPPMPLHQGKCSPSQAQQVTDCLMTTAGATPTCDSFMTSYQNGGCIQCAVTSVNAPKRGPILDDGQLYYTNPAGCIAALSGDSSAQSCGATFDTLYSCEWNACSECNATEQNYNDCADEADKGACASWASAKTCSKIYETQCLGTSPADEGLKLVNLFCGH